MSTELAECNLEFKKPKEIIDKGSCFRDNYRFKRYTTAGSFHRKKRGVSFKLEYWQSIFRTLNVDNNK